MPILRGRAFGPEDGPDESRSRSIIIDQTFAERYFPGKDPLGLHLDDNQRSGAADDDPEKYPPLTIVGIVPRTRNEAAGEDNVEKLNFVHMYLCATQNPAAGNMLMLRVRGGDPKALAAAVRREVEAIDPEQPIAQVTTMEENISNSLAARRLTMSLLGTFAALALALASVGLYGVMALSVTQRTRELGIRLALGARARRFFGWCLGQGATLVAIGIGLGLIGCDRCKPCLKQRALRRRCARCSRACDRYCFARVCRAARVLAARSPRHPGRSNPSVARRMTQKK